MSKKYHSVGTSGTQSTYYELLDQNGGDTSPEKRKRGLWSENGYTLTKKAQTQNRVKLYRNGIVGQQYPESRVFLDRQTVAWTSRYQDPAFASVISRLGEKWRGTDISLGIYVSPEGRESMTMILDSLKKIANSAHALKHGDFGGAVRSLNRMPRKHVKRAHDRFSQGDLSGSFLAMHLGWTPLIKDIYTASQPIKFGEKGQRIDARKAGSPSTGNWKSPTSTSGTFKEVGSLTLKGVIGRKPTWSQALGLENPFLIAWELVPLSFVADYFLPIGDVLDSLGVISQARFSKLFKCSYYKYELRGSLPAMTLFISPYWRNIEPANCYISSRAYKREPWVLSFSDVVKSIRVTLPSSVTRLSTMVALVHQRILALKR